MATVSNQPIRSPRDGILAELNDKLNKRREVEHSSEVTSSPLNKRKYKPRPPLKNRSESLVDVQKYRVTPSDGISQSQSAGSVQSDHFVVANGHSSKSLPKSRLHTVLGGPPTVLGPPPTGPPPTFKAQAPRYKSDSKTSKGAPGSPPSRKKAHRLLKKFKKKQTRKVSEIPPNQISRVTMETMSSPEKKGYQNIFDFERKESSSSPIGQSEGFNKTPKKPMPLPRTNSMSSSSVRGISTPDSPHTQEGGKEQNNVPIKGRLVARKPIRRRTTKREARHLRNGVSSDSETKPFNSSSDDDDGYIKMNSTLTPMNLELSTFNPRASGYYLKILPSDSLSGGRDRRALSEEPMTLLRDDQTSDSDIETDPSYLQILSSDDLLSPDSPDYIPMDMWSSDSLAQNCEEEFSNSESFERDEPSNWLSSTTPTPISDSTQIQNNRPLIKGSSHSLGTTALRQIKYSDVTIHPIVDGLPRKPSKPQKFKYQEVTLNQEPTKSSPILSQTNEPIERIYYKTTTKEGETPPLTNLLPGRRFQIHSYVEIDTDDIEQMGLQFDQSKESASSGGLSSQPSLYKLAPPTIPHRPDDLDGWAESTVHSRQHVITGDYSYVKRETMIPVWLTSRQKIGLSSSCKVEALSSEIVPPSIPLPPGVPLPPSVPPKTASLLREVGVRPFQRDSSPQPYLYPVFMKKRAHTQGSPNHRITLSKVARLKKKGNKSDNPPPVLPYKPKETLSRSITMATTLQHNPLKMSQSIPVGVGTTTLPPTRSTRPLTPTQLAGNSCKNNNFDNDVISPIPPSESEGQGCDGCSLETHMDSVSLSVLCRHGDEIVKRLSTGYNLDEDSHTSHTRPHTPTHHEKQETGMEGGRSLETGMEGGRSLETGMEGGRSLEQVVSELDIILRNNLCSKTQLIRAIENQLHIQLLSGGTKEQEDGILSGGTKEHEDDILSGDTQKQEDEILSGGTKEQEDEPLSGGTEDDILSGGTKEDDDDNIKPRSRTMICNDEDSDNEPITCVQHTRTQSSPSLPRKPHMNHPRTFSSSHIPLTKIEHSCYENSNEGAHRQDGGRCYSNGWNQLKRTNAQKRRTSSSQEVGVVTLHSDGHGVFTHPGGTLTMQDCGVCVEVPVGAVLRGQRQRLMFTLPHTTFDPQALVNTSSLSDLSGSYIITADHVTSRKDRRVQLSSCILIGPSDAVLNQPIKIKLPHCLSYLNNSWHLQVLGRPYGSPDEDSSWTDITNTMGLVDLPNKKHKTHFKQSTYQMHLDYITITTKELGYFKLMGRPVMNGVLSAKQMLACVYSDPSREIVEVYVIDALTHHHQALHHTLTGRGRQCLVGSMPLLCFGDGKDMELMITSLAKPLGTMAIPFGQFWRQKVIGQSQACFHIEPTLIGQSRTLTLKIQQAGAKYIHETNFVVP